MWGPEVDRPGVPAGMEDDLVAEVVDLLTGDAAEEREGEVRVACDVCDELCVGAAVDEARQPFHELGHGVGVVPPSGTQP